MKLEHYIKEVHSVTNVTEKFMEITKFLPDNPLLKVDLTYEFRGQIERKNVLFYKKEWETAQKLGKWWA